MASKSKKTTPVPNKRKSTGKRLRFSIFARDNFTCRYCGVQADNAVLVLDHVIPVAKGGTSDEANLITACEACNQGKAAKLINEAALSDNDRLKFAQERNEQLKQALIAKEALDARREMQDLIAAYWCEARGTKEMIRSVAHTLSSFVAQHGPTEVFSWINIAAENLPAYKTDVEFAKYICGIRRKKMEKGEIQ